jgi:hypothetical protein
MYDASPAVMQILALPSPGSHFYSASSKELFQARQGRLSPFRFAGHTSEEVADQSIQDKPL